MVFFMIGTPILGGSQDPNPTWKFIQNEVFSGSMGSSNCSGQIVNTQIEQFKLGNLDTLLHTGEVMQKLENQMEGLLRKIERQYLDLTDQVKYDFNIDNQDQSCNIEQFLFKFKWADKIFPRSQPLPELVGSLQKRMNIIDADFRQKSQTYQEKKNVQTSIALKEGNLYIKDLADVLQPSLVQEADFRYTENITTVIAVVPKAKEQQFLDKYEEVSENVLPQSAKKFNVEDKDQLTLWRIFLYTKDFKKQAEQEDGKKKKIYRSPVENFIYQMRDVLGLTVREFKYSKQAYENKQQARNQIQKETATVTTVLENSCKNQFSELYNAYIHLKHLRLIVDIASRFGQREPTMTAILKPGNGKEKKVVTDLMRIFCDPSQMGMYGTKEELEDTEDFYPFCYIPINIV